MGSDLRDGRTVMGVLKSDNDYCTEGRERERGKRWEKKGEDGGSRSSAAKRSLKSVVDLPRISHVILLSSWSHGCGRGRLQPSS